MSGRPSKLVPTPAQPIACLLIANRGEIALRIASTCKLLSIPSLAIYTTEDSSSQHISAADSAICLGSIQDQTGNPHQNGSLLIETALANGATAIHPGYGYLSENAEFAKQVRDAGLIFVGPSPHAIGILGDKRAAKEFLLRHASDVPLVPGYGGTAQDPETLEREAERIGFPVLIKAVAGGGGKGMRIVRDRESLKDELTAAQSEAKRSFGSSDCLLEKYVEKGKHVEVQIFGDASGKVIVLGERECSVQRRHQKIIEEAPSVWVDQREDDFRARMYKAAIQIGELLQYENAGTVEFLVDVDAGEFYFLEVNTRIQVEHAITEEVWGIDIVALQLYVATGGLLKDCQGLSTRTKPTGHSIECRLCAEDPSQNFMPDSGLILNWTPGTEFLNAQQTADVRIDAAIMSGADVSVYFDSMIAKIIVWAIDRTTAVAKMAEVLKHTIIVGIKTNYCFLQSCLLHPRFSEDVAYTTNFIPENIDTLLQNPYLATKKLLQNWQDEISFLPGLFARWVANPLKMRNSYQPFGSIQTRFRNQPYDTNNQLQDIVTINNANPSSKDSDGKISQPSTFLLTWSTGRNPPKDTYSYRTQSISIPDPSQQDQPTKDKENTDDLPDPGTELAKYFNSTFTSQLQQNPPPFSPQQTIRTISMTVEKHSRPNNSSITWLIATINLLRNNGLQKIYTVTTTPAYLQPRTPGTPEILHVTVPALGTTISTSRHTFLSWGESQRPHFSSEIQLDPARTYTAAMPCKILRILKRKGDQVKAGEAMFVIESMKTEVRIVAAVEGTFEPEIEEGAAVGEGTVLCRLA